MTDDQDHIDELESRRRQQRAVPPPDDAKPRLQAETNRSSRGRRDDDGFGGPTRPTAVGYGDSGEPFKAGQNVACRIVAAEPGGYRVEVLRTPLTGFLPTNARFEVGERVLAQFVCITNNRVVLFSRPSDGSSAVEPNPTEYREQDEAAFAVWSSELRPSAFRRTVDLLPQQSATDTTESIRMGDADIDWIITNIEGGMRTGCMRLSNEVFKTRSAALFYKGRVVGCAYSAETLAAAQPTEPSLQMMLEDLQDCETRLLFHDLSDEIVLSASSLFLGYEVDHTDDLDGRSYLDYIGSWLQQKEQTACIAITTSQNSPCLAYVYKGRYIGSFYVKDQTYSPDISFVFDLLNGDRSAQVAASILPPAMTSSAVRFGFSLKEAWMDR